MTHDELNALCAEKVAGYYWATHDKASGTHWVQHPDSKLRDGWTKKNLSDIPKRMRSILGVPDYVNDPAAVIALLEKHDWEAGSLTLGGGCYCEINFAESSVYETAPTFAEAGVRALLKAHGCEVGE